MINRKNIISKHPLVGDIKYGNIEATAFVKVDPKKVTMEDLSTVIKQNNYMHLHKQTIASHLSQIEEKFLPTERGKCKINDVKLVLIKSVITLSKVFNTTTPLNEDFLEKLTKNLGSLKIYDSIEAIDEESDVNEIIINFMMTGW